MAVKYRAIHEHVPWKRVGNHADLESAINGDKGAKAVLLGTGRYVRKLWAERGRPQAIFVWKEGQEFGFLFRINPVSPQEVQKVRVPASLLEQYDKKRACPASEIERHFRVSSPVSSEEELDEPHLEISGGRFPDLQTRREIEIAAVNFVASTLEAEGFVVHDHQRANRGYDFFATRDAEELYVEVKGTDASEPRFFISRNERRFAREHQGWRLFVVCRAREEQELFRYSNADMEAAFNFDELAWQCTKIDA